LAKHRIPSFLTTLDKETKTEVMMVQEDEKSGFSSWFQTKWNRAKNLGKREVLRKLTKDLT
jgi:hypothetical protein